MIKNRKITEAIQMLKCFNTVEAIYFWINKMGLSNSEKGFILLYLGYGTIKHKLVNKGDFKMSKLTNKDIECYLIDCLGYDELMIDEIKENFKPLKSALSDRELKDCQNYYE